MKEQILILGNGFNKALGLHVNYGDFFKSAEWNICKKDYSHSMLIQYILTSVKRNSNIEDLLKEYVHDDKILTADPKEDNLAFNYLEEAFAKYVQKKLEQKMNLLKIDKDEKKDFIESYALNFLSDFQNQLKSGKVEGSYIYSFCYTNFKKIHELCSKTREEDIESLLNGEPFGNKLGAFLNINYMHGNSEGVLSNIILGISKQSFRGCPKSIQDNYEFLLKSKHDTYFKPYKKQIIQSLFRVDNIVFYGFGFTQPDFPYIKEWLKTKPNFNGKREIQIITSKASKPTIIKTMRQLSGRNWASFIKKYNIYFIYQDEIKEKYTPRSMNRR